MVNNETKKTKNRSMLVLAATTSFSALCLVAAYIKHQEAQQLRKSYHNCLEQQVKAAEEAVQLKGRNEQLEYRMQHVDNQLHNQTKMIEELIKRQR